MSKLKIFAGTWNLGGEGSSCSADVENWAQCSRKEGSFNLYVFGFQEVVEINTQSHLWFPSQVYLQLVEAITRGLGDKFVLTACRGLGQMFIVVFADKVVQSNLTKAITLDVACGHMNIIGNKGATGVKLTFNGKEDLFLLNSHLAAHKQNTHLRNENYHRIMNTLKAYMTSNRWSIIWVGDLNYRIDLDNVAVRGTLSTDSPDLASLLGECQLKKTMASKDSFDIFCESPITFAPTYKFDMGTNVYDTSRKQRVPAWTDRVLWAGFNANLRNVKAKGYQSWNDYTTSDHRPVSVGLTIDLHLPSWVGARSASLNVDDTTRSGKAASLQSGPTPLLVRAGELVGALILGIGVYANYR